MEIEGIGVGRLEDRQENGLPSVEADAGVLILGAQLDPADILEPDDAAVTAGFQHDIFELLHVRKAAEGAQGNLALLPAAHRLLADGSRGDLGILLADSPHHIGGGQPPRG